MLHNETLKIVDAHNRQVGLVKAIKNSKKYVFVWSIFSLELSGPPGKTGEAKTRDEALRDALEAGATLGIDGARAKDRPRSRNAREA